MSDVIIHETAEVSEEAEIGPGTRIWHWVHVRAGARVGARCVLGQNVYVAPTACLGEGVRVQNNVSIYDGVVLEDFVFCGPSVVFTNVRTPRSEFPRRDAFVPTRVGRGASLGANATVICGVNVGAYAMVGAGAVVTRDVAPHGLILGVPGRRVGWVCRCGVPLEEAPGEDSGPKNPDEATVLCCPGCDISYVECEDPERNGLKEIP